MSLCLTLASDGGEIAFVAVAGGLTLGLVSMIACTITRLQRTRQHEESRREIAAYVAEGSISAGDAAKLLAAGKTLRDIRDA